MLDLLAQVAAVPDDGGVSSLFTAGGAGAIAFGIITALGTQARPLVEAWLADRQAAREYASLQTAKALEFLEERVDLDKDRIEKLKADVAHWRALAEHAEARIAALTSASASTSAPPAPGAPP